MYRNMRQVALAMVVVGAMVAAPFGHHAPGAHAKQITIGFANLELSDPFPIDVQNSMEASAKAHGYKLISLNNNLDPNTALRNASILVNDKVDLAVEFQVDAKVAPAIAAMFKAAHIPAIAIDIPQPGAIFFGADNFGDGELTGIALGNYAKSHNWDPNKITEILISQPASGPIVELRVQGIDYGIRKVLPTLPKSALFEHDGQGSITVSQRVVADLLPRIPRDNHIVISAINDPDLLGALRAVQLAGRENSTVLAGQNASAEALREIRTDPHWIGDTAYFPEWYGYFIMQLAAKMLSHQTVTPYVFIPTLFIDRSNIAQYYPGNSTVAKNPPPGNLIFSQTPRHVR